MLSGENYSGMLLAAKIKAKIGKDEKNFSWMIKFPAADPNRVLTSRMTRMEEKEIRFYSEFLPRLKQFLVERKADVKLNYCKVRKVRWWF